MRPATKEERESVDRYIKSISHKTGVKFDVGDDDYEENFEFIAEHPKADMSKVNKIVVNGKEYVSIDYALEIIDSKRAPVEDIDSIPNDEYMHSMVWNDAVDDVFVAISGLKGEQE